MKTTAQFCRNLEIRDDVDVLVAGGGPAGIAAALTAARQGCTVQLLEAESALGGMGTLGMVPAFMAFTDGENFLADGIGREILERLQKAGGTVPENGCAIRVEVLKRIYDEMLSESTVRLCFHTRIVDVDAESGLVQQVICAGKGGLFVVRAKVFLDATGDGDICAFAGAEYEKGDEKGQLMPGTLCSLWSGIDWEAVEKSGSGTGNSQIEEAFRDGVFTLEDRHLPGMWRVGRTLGGGNIGHTFNVDGTNEASLTQAYLWGRKSLLEYEHYYKKYLKGFENMELVATAPLLGIRETRRILGDYVLNLDDFQNRAVFADEIGRFSYPIDIHIARPDKESYDKFYKEFTTCRLNSGESYGIPYRILTPHGFQNLLVAGRCVSTDRHMQASIRVMPGCFITGQAVGMAAAVMTENKCHSRSIDVKELQKRLLAIGAYLPNADV